MVWTHILYCTPVFADGNDMVINVKDTEHESSLAVMKLYPESVEELN